MAMKAEVGNDFATVLAKAQERPGAETAGRDLPDAFPFAPPADHKIVDTTDADPKAIPGTVKYSYKIHRRVFMIWRPWESCTRCKDDIANQRVSIPDVGDYECAHNNKTEYENTQNDILAGRLLYGSEQEVVQRDGSIVISLRWYEPVLSKRQIRERAKMNAIGSDWSQKEEPPI